MLTCSPKHSGESTGCDLSSGLLKTTRNEEERGACPPCVEKMKKATPLLLSSSGIFRGKPGPASQPKFLPFLCC
jgi:hypothetical protein